MEVKVTIFTSKINRNGTTVILGRGKVFLPDLKTYTLKVEALRALGMCQFLAPARIFQENHDDIIWLKKCGNSE